MQIKYTLDVETVVSPSQRMLIKVTERQVSEERNYQVWMGHPVHSNCRYKDSAQLAIVLLSSVLCFILTFVHHLCPELSSLSCPSS